MTEGRAVLADLLELERRLEAEVAVARADAERRLAAAREEAQRLARDEGDPLGVALAALRDALARETAREIAGIEDAARAEVARHRDVDDETLLALARDVVDRLTATGD